MPIKYFNYEAKCCSVLLFFLAGNAFRNSPSTAATVEMFEEHEGTHILQSLDGFAISLNSDGRFLYISETVSIYLGLSQVSWDSAFSPGLDKHDY